MLRATGGWYGIFHEAKGRDVRMIADNDLVSMQQARILAENAREAQKKLALFPQEKLDAIVDAVAKTVAAHSGELARLSQEETGYGKWQDKVLKNDFACTQVPKLMRGMSCVGIIAEDRRAGLMEVGVPVGVVAALCPSTSPVSTTIYKTLVAVKSGNAIIFSPHPRAERCMGKALDIMIGAAQAAGLPKGCLSYMQAVSKRGAAELMNHPAVSLIMLSGVPGMYPTASLAGKPVIYGGRGNGPAFVERSADIRQAVADIVASKTFDNGTAPSSEQSLVVDAAISDKVKQALVDYGAYFMSEEESQRLAGLFFYSDGRCRRKMVGISAKDLAHEAALPVPEHVSILIAERKYVSESDPYSGGFLSPVLAYYVEDNWEYACEKCIELLFHEKNAHTLSIHSNNDEVIRMFALKKPVGRLLVNTPASFGGTGATTNLFPSLCLGSGSAGFGITSDNVSPMNLIYRRKVGFGVRQAGVCKKFNAMTASGPAGVYPPPLNEGDTAEVLYRILTEALKAMDGPSGK